MVKVLGDLIGRVCLVNVDGVLVWGGNCGAASKVGGVVGAAASKSTICGCSQGNVLHPDVEVLRTNYSGTVAPHDFERIKGLLEIAAAVNWVGRSCPGWWILQPLCGHQRNRGCTILTAQSASFAKNLSGVDWLETHREAWQRARAMLLDAVKLAFARLYIAS